MIVVGIDTCGATGSIALGRVRDGATSVLEQTQLPGKTYSAELMPALRRLLTVQRIDKGDLEAVVVVNGPGSFTGIRIGVSSAKGLAEGLRIPLLAVSRLAVLAWKADAEHAALDAGRGEIYFRAGATERLLTVRNLPTTNSIGVSVCEAGMLQVFPEGILVEPPTADDALMCSAGRLMAGDFADVGVLDGNYVRRSDAEIFAKPARKV